MATLRIRHTAPQFVWAGPSSGAKEVKYEPVQNADKIKIGLYPLVIVVVFSVLILLGSLAQMAITQRAASIANDETALQWADHGFCIGGFGLPGHSCATGADDFSRRVSAGRLGMLLVNLAGAATAVWSVVFTLLVYYFKARGRWCHGRELSKWAVCLTQFLVVLITTAHLIRLSYNVHYCSSQSLLKSAWCMPGANEHSRLAHALRIWIPWLVATRAALLLAVFNITVMTFGNPGDYENKRPWSIAYWPDRFNWQPLLLRFLETTFCYKRVESR